MFGRLTHEEETTVYCNVFTKPTLCSATRLDAYLGVWVDGWPGSFYIPRLVSFPLPKSILSTVIMRVTGGFALTPMEAMDKQPALGRWQG